MKKRLYFFSLIVMPLALSSCTYKTTTNVSNTPVSKEGVETNENKNSGNTNVNTNININKPVNTNVNTNKAQINTNIAKPKTVNITLSGFAFNPKTITIKKGTTIIWTNLDPAGHTVSSDSDSTLNFSSGILNKNDKYQLTFNSVGSFSYHCSPHPNMTAKIIVVE